MTERATQSVGDLADLPGSGSGPANLVWWGNFGFMLIEGMGFLLGAATYLYLMARNPAWPPPGDSPPDLLWGTVFTVVLLASGFPNHLLKRAALTHRASAVRWLAVAMILVGLVLAGLRAMEFMNLGVGWSQDAYGSAVWMLMVLHSAHIVTEIGETGVQALWLFTHHVGDDQFGDMEDDANYWNFVIVAWLPLYGLVYWLPRLV